ncbi:hypothetical protein Q0590_03135 [Rhodocytophaga aerolata]|uniref:Hint domain-containing protein n=1 Tax=Rhodocytophaga aerolata TaxID=455078 RepID=A0ABT8R0M8_9BACT|nr:Hint domain-containing protein [Rhodocytophaga aerolata]MDO1445226.1 hypothetical protein [Rhodocytophaga aerolata]
MFNLAGLYSRLSATLLFTKGMLFLVNLFLLLFICSASYGQVYESKAEAAQLPRLTRQTSAQGFPAGSLVLMADGKEKKIEDIQPGEWVASYDPVLEDYVVSSITHIHSSTLEEPMISIMLILDDFSASLQHYGSLAGVSIVSTTTAKILTSKGPTHLQNLTENDVLYCYDTAAHRFLRFRMYTRDMLLPDAAAQPVYQIETEARNYIINGTVFLQADEL